MASHFFLSFSPLYSCAPLQRESTLAFDFFDFFLINACSCSCSCSCSCFFLVHQRVDNFEPSETQLSPKHQSGRFPSSPLFFLSALVYSFLFFLLLFSFLSSFTSLFFHFSLLSLLSSFTDSLVSHCSSHTRPTTPYFLPRHYGRK